MLWYKSWLETRWRFVLGLILLALSAASTVFAYPEVIKLLPLASNVDLSGEIGRRVAESAQLARSYRGYVWSQWFVQNMPQQWVLFAVLLGTGGLLSQASGGGALFTLSLPVSRSRLIGVRAAVALGQLLVLAIVPALLLPLLSPAIGQTYSVGDALVHAICMFVAGTVFFSLTFLLSTVFSDVWRPALIVLCIATALGLLEYMFRDLSRFSLYHVMSAESYFHGGGVPWLGLFASTVISAAAVYAAIGNIARQDF
jgi:ABC-2 type transport system permease protein